MMKIALAQIKTSPKWQENLEKILKLLNETKKQEAHLVVFQKLAWPLCQVMGV